MNFIYGLIVGIAVSAVACWAYFRFIKKPVEAGAKTVYMSADEAKKQENLNKIKVELAGMDRITNKDVERLTGVADPTATRYLDALEAEGLLRQVSLGKDTYYDIIK